MVKDIDKEHRNVKSDLALASLIDAVNYILLDDKYTARQKLVSARKLMRELLEQEYPYEG